MLRSAAKHRVVRAQHDRRDPHNQQLELNVCNIHLTTRSGAPFQDRTPDSQLVMAKLCTFEGTSRPSRQFRKPPTRHMQTSRFSSPPALWFGCSVQASSLCLLAGNTWKTFRCYKWSPFLRLSTEQPDQVKSLSCRPRIGPKCSNWFRLRSQGRSSKEPPNSDFTWASGKAVV